MRRKNAMFYNASGRGDHARIMMTASALCTDSVAEARMIDSYFPDVRAYIASIQPPPWPFMTDTTRASRGREVFNRVCSTCHGTYGEGGSYPNLLVGLREVGTDPTLALGASQFSQRFVDWYNRSYYGEAARIEPQQGYVAPPLDGIWATAPYLHNGSVPTLSTLLDSRERPRFWTRAFTSNDYDPDAVGWRFTSLDHGHAGEPDLARRSRIYDTTQPGYNNQGHTYGDALTAEERSAVIEYLKTL
jgi:mono/diheme cytochrome c family protein